MSEIDKKAMQILRLYDNIDANSDRASWIEQSEKAFNFFLGKQLTEEELKELKDKKMPSFIVNKTTPQIELMQYFLTSRNPRWQAVGFDETDSAQSEIHAKLAQYIWKINRGQTIFAQTVRDSLSKGVGYIKIGVDPDLDDGMGEVSVESEDPWNVAVDPHSRDPFFSDASWIMIAKDMTIEKAMYEFPEINKDEFLTIGMNNRDLPMNNYQGDFPVHGREVSDSYDSESYMNEFIKYFEFYEKRKVPYVNVFLKIEGEIKNFVITEKEFNKIIREEKKAGTSKFAESIVDEIRFNKKKVFKTECIGTKIIAKEIQMPGEYYPIIPLCYRHTGTPFPSSVAMDLVGKQEEVNKSHQIMIHHANLSSVPRWLAESGQITDIEEFQSNSSVPGKVLEYNPNTEGKPPTNVQPSPLNNAFYTISEKGVRDMEYISGMSSYTMGQGDRSGRETYRGMLAQDDFGTRRVRGFANNSVNEFLGIVGVVIDDFARELYQTEKIFHVANPDDPELIERKVINPVTEEGIANFKNKKKTRYNIVFIGGSTLLVNRWAELEEMIDLYEKGIVGKTDVLMKTDLGNKKAIMERMDEINQAMGQIQQLQEEVEKLAKNNEVLERQLVNARISSKVSDANIDLNAEKQSFVAKLREILSVAGNDAERKKIEIEKLISELEQEKTAATKQKQ